MIRLNCFVSPREMSGCGQGCEGAGPSSVGVQAKPSAILVVRTPRPPTIPYL